MKYSLFFYLLFIGFCRIFAQLHLGHFPGGETFFHKITHATNDVLHFAEAFIRRPNYPGCPVPTPECPNEAITFWYYSRILGDEPIPMRFVSSKSVEVDKGPGPWKILIHGFGQSKEGFPVKDLITAYKEKGEYNILVVEFDSLVKKECLHSAVLNMPFIAKCTGEMLDFLIDTNLFTSDLLHVIGFGLGAQIAGALHKFMDNNKLGRVTALDPFSINTLVVQEITVSELSASFVDVIHTNAIFKFVLEKVGHAEFFFNSGVVQPGCYHEDSGSELCSHARSVKYFIESLEYEASDTGFFAIPCSNYEKFIISLCSATDETLIKVGEYADPKARGIFYLQTNHDPPFAAGRKYKFDPAFSL